MSSILFALCAWGADSTPLDLQPVANVSIKEGFGGNFENNNFAKFDMEETAEKGVKFKFGKKFVAIPTDEQSSGAAPADANKPKEEAAEKKGEGEKNPLKAIRGIKVGKGFANLHVIHATQHAAQNDGDEIGWYVLHYKGGETRKLPIKYGKHAIDWWSFDDALDKKPSEAEIFWEGTNDAITKFRNDKSRIRLYRAKFENPKPELEVETIDLECAEGPCRPFVFAMTVE